MTLVPALLACLLTFFLPTFFVFFWVVFFLPAFLAALRWVAMLEPPGWSQFMLLVTF